MLLTKHFENFEKSKFQSFKFQLHFHNLEHFHPKSPASSSPCFGQQSFLGMVRQIEQATIHLFLEEVAVCADHKVSGEVGDNFLLIVGDPQGIIDQQLGPDQMNLLNIIINLIYDIKLYFYDYLNM